MWPFTYQQVLFRHNSVPLELLPAVAYRLLPNADRCKWLIGVGLGQPFNPYRWYATTTKARYGYRFLYPDVGKMSAYPWR